MADDGSDPGPSELGTKEYWDSTYERDLENFESYGDIGDVWFGEESVDRVITWLLESEDKVDKDSSILDVGCGNGIFLLRLACEDFTSLYGVDYSENAIKLAKAIAEEKKLNITYEQKDLLTEKDGLASKKYKIVHDKGTYDAVSLHPEDRETKRKDYINALHNITEDNGIFIITSCNWTLEELKTQFIGYFAVKKVLPTPTFMFGGKIGSPVTAIVFDKISV